HTTRSAARITVLLEVFESLILHVFVHPLGAYFRAKDVAVDICRDTLGGACSAGLVRRVRNKRSDRAVTDASDPDAAFPVFMRRRNRPRLGIGDIDDVVLVDEDAARPAELVPLVDEVPLLVENLDAVVAAVAEEEAPARIHRQRM